MEIALIYGGFDNAPADVIIKELREDNLSYMNDDVEGVTEEFENITGAYDKNKRLDKF